MKDQLKLDLLINAVETASKSCHNPYAYQAGYYKSILKHLNDSLLIESALADRYKHYVKGTLISNVAVPTESL